MSFVKKIIGPDETLIGISGAHWIYGATGIVWLAGMMIVGLVLDGFASKAFDGLVGSSGNYAGGVLGDILFWLPTALGALMFLLYLLMMIAPEIALTSKRVIYKTGIIFVDVKEVDLEELKAADVNHGVLGRFLNYGFIIFDARFVEGMTLPAIGNPYRFVKALNEARSALKGDMPFIGEGDKAKKEEPDVPHLSDKRYDDAVETTPGGAIHAVAEEANSNLKHAVKQELHPEEPAPKKSHPKKAHSDQAHAKVFHQDVVDQKMAEVEKPSEEPLMPTKDEPKEQPEAEGQKPIVFHPDPNLEQQLEKKILTDFETAEPLGRA